MFTRMVLSILLASSLGACQATQPPRQAVAAVAEAPSPSPSPTPTAKPLALVTLGASDVTGLGADDPATESWAPVLATMLTGKPAHTRLGQPGWTAAQIRANALQKAIAAKPDVAVVWAGANDFNHGVGVEAFKADLEAILAGLAGTGARVYVVNLPDLDRLPAFTSGATMLSLAVPVWQAAVRDAADRHDAHVVELAPYSDELDAHPEWISPDGFHPSTKGYRRVAEIVAAAIGAP